MFEDILVVTDRNDLAEVPLRYQSARGRRFLDRLKAIGLELLFPTGPTTLEGDAGPDDVEVQPESATGHATDLATHHGARLHVLFVVDAVRYDTTVAFATEPLVEEGEATVDELVDAAERAGVEATGAVEVGRPAALVLNYAADNDVDLIVLNARPRARRWLRLRADPVATIIDRARVPVYVVPAIQPGHPD